MGDHAYRKRLQELLDAALDSRRPIADALRMSFVLGSESGSQILKNWAKQELEGYSSDEDCPDYRKVSCLLALDGFTSTHQIKRQTVTPELLPETARSLLDKDTHFNQPIAQLAELADQHARPDDSGLRVSPAYVALLITNVNAYLRDAYKTSGMAGRTPHVESIYWVVEGSSLRGIVDAVRTRLVQLASELLEALPADDELTQGQVDHAASVIIMGDVGNYISGGVTESVVAGSGSGQTKIDASQALETPKTSRWVRFARALGSLVGAAAAITAIVEFVVWLTH